MSIGDIAKQVDARPGQVVTVALGGADATELVHALDVALDDGRDIAPEVHFVLGRGGRTREGTIAQFVAALRLPYAAAEDWDAFIYQLGEGSVGSRRCIVVADAQELLADDAEAREELLFHLPSGPHCLGGGWTTVVLAAGPGQHS
ncbi:hypothetical protein [Dactylosporangium sp. NPDC051541]|uniref:hypothetical protein n=1 Tax=Dactylosporangium sp. NPDC051541 TaxID=3363977 RepID=UPI0037A64B9D